MLTGFHSLNLDIASFGRVIHLDGRHVAACLDMSITVFRQIKGSYLPC